jgi:thioester reductase-like protein
MTVHFLTGYPGFLGSQLLPRVLAQDPSSRAICLVQERFMELARSRLTELRLASPGIADRVSCVAGDITRPDLGLGSVPLEEIAAETRSIWHLAAAYDLSVERERAVAVNVVGTRHTLGFASRCRGLERFHHVSTCYVSGRYAGIFAEDDLQRGQTFNNHYEETKHAAEVAVRAAMTAGMPATIYRPAIVVGDSRTGETRKYDGPYYVIRWILRQPRTAFMPLVGDPYSTRVNLVPSDFVVDAIAHLSSLPHSLGRTYQLADPEPLTVAELLDAIADAAGKNLRTVRVPGRAARWAIDRIPGVYRVLGIPSAALDYFSLPTHYTVFRARTDLEGSGIQVPRFAEYARRLVQFVREHPNLERENPR